MYDMVDAHPFGDCGKPLRARSALFLNVPGFVELRERLDPILDGTGCDTGVVS